MFVRLIREGENQGSAFHQLLVCNESLFDLLTVEGYFRDVTVVSRIVGTDGQGLPIGQLNRRLIEERRGQSILVTAWANRVKAKSTQDIPGRHLSTILVTDDSLRCGLVHFVEQSAGPFLCFPGLAYIII